MFNNLHFFYHFILHVVLFGVSYGIGSAYKGNDQQYKFVKGQECSTDFTNLSNYGFFFTATLISYMMTWKHWRLYNAHLVLYLTLVNVGVSSTLYHTSDDFGSTGDMDVSALITVIVAVLWFIVWSVYVTYRQRNNDYTVLTSNWTIIWFGGVGLFCLFMYLITWYDPWQFSWPVKYQIFFALIGSLIVCGVVLFSFIMYTKGIKESIWKLISVMTVFIPVIIAAVVIYENPDKYLCESHGFYSHIGLSTLINILVVYMNNIFQNQMRVRSINMNL
jgi:hypothetical protein